MSLAATRERRARTATKLVDYELDEEPVLCALHAVIVQSGGPLAPGQRHDIVWLLCLACAVCARFAEGAAPSAALHAVRCTTVNLAPSGML